jgi:anti-sigma-K factor RskA
MSPDERMTCDERRDRLMLYAADALDSAERATLAAHLASGCPRCAGSLAEAEAVLAHLPMALDPVAPSEGVRATLMRRVAAEPRTTGKVIPMPAPPERGARPRPAGDWLRPALAALAASLVTAVALTVPGERARRELLAQLETQDREIVRLREAVEASAETVRVLRSPAVRVVSLSGTGPQPQAAARVFWDTTRRTWHFYAASLRPPGAGRTYQLWFITPGQEKISAGTFDVDAQGEASVEVAIPPGLDAIAVAAVTDEPAGGSPQPTGSIHLAGAVAPSSS